MRGDSRRPTKGVRMRSDGSPSTAEPPFRVARALKLGSFHIGSSLSDLLTSAVWNRVLIADLGVAAWPVALLSALRYLLTPLVLWAGHRSDTRPILGSYRVAYIWLGRLLMLLSLPLLPPSLVLLGADAASPLGWGMALASFLLYGVGTLISGAPFLALVHDSAPYARRGQAVGIVQIMLVVSFAFIPIVYARLMPTYTAEDFARLVWIGMAGAALFWVWSVWGEERPRDAATDQMVKPPALSLRATLSTLWADVSARRYAIFLATSAFFAFMQDAMLEPFGGDVFGLAAGETTRFNAYWGTGVLLAMLATLALTRRRRPDQQVATTAWGLIGLGLALLALGVASWLRLERLLVPVLFLFGIGFGVFTVGGVSLLMAVNVEGQAGSYLALWSAIQLVARGAGIAMGGIVRDVGMALSGEAHLAYALLFAIEALGVLASVWLLARVGVDRFAARRSIASTQPAPAMIAE